MKLEVVEGASEERHRQLLMGLMKGAGGGAGKGNEGVQVDTIHAYLSSLRVRAVRDRWRDWAITQVAEENGGNNLTAATRLLSFYHLPLSAFPRVSYLKRKHEVWWSCRMGKSDEFGDLLVGSDVKLQRKLIQQLSRHRYAGDLDRMHRRIRQWHLHADEDVRAILSTLSTSPPQPPSAAEDAQGDIDVPYYTVPLSSIVFVHDLPTLALASTTLAQCEGALGLDCEYIPEAFHQLGLAASHTQLLQVSCESHSFLFDLQCLSLPTDEALIARMVDVLMAVMSREGVKVGIGFAEDLRKLRKDFAHLACFQVTVSQYADLTPLLKEERTATPTQPVEPETKKKEKKWKEKQKQRQWKAKVTSNPSHSQPQPSSPFSLGEDSVDSDSKAPDTLSLPEEPPSPSPSPPLPTADSTAALAPSTFVPFAPKVGGLAKLCRQYVGLRLDKACQISQWARRPLTPQQTMYAACDAHVQLLIYAEAVRRGRSLKEVDLEG